MALRTSFSASDTSNLVIDDALCVKYEKHIIEGSWQQTSSMGTTVNSWGRMLEIHRYATKRFRYVGLSYAAAVQCRAAMMTKFTRSVPGPQYWDALNGSWHNDDSGTNMSLCTASISMRNTDADSYEVYVDVNEDDLRMAKPNYGGALKSAFANIVTSRTYGNNAHGTADETEPT